MNNLTIKDKLDNLLKIQNIDLKLDEITKVRGDLPEVFLQATPANADADKQQGRDK